MCGASEKKFQREFIAGNHQNGDLRSHYIFHIPKMFCFTRPRATIGGFRRVNGKQTKLETELSCKRDRPIFQALFQLIKGPWEIPKRKRKGMFLVS